MEMVQLMDIDTDDLTGTKSDTDVIREALNAPPVAAATGLSSSRQNPGEAESNTAVAPTRVVYLQFFVWKVSNINTATQTFDALFNLRASFEEESSKLDQSANPSSNTDPSRWTATDFPWKPQLRFFNMQHEYKDEREEWWRVTSDKTSRDELPKSSPDDSFSQPRRVWVHQHMRVRGTFEERLELQDFPIDLQLLHITVTSSWDHQTALLKWADFDTSAISVNASVSQVFEMGPPRLIDYSSDWDGDVDLPLLSLPHESRTQARYCRAHIGLVMARNSSYYVYNILCVQMVICVSNFSVFFVPLDDGASRIDVMLTLILASAAFKFVTTSMLPETHYLTMLDQFGVSVLVQQMLILVAVCVEQRHLLRQADEIDEHLVQRQDDELFIACGLITGILCAWFALRWRSRYRAREAELRRIATLYESRRQKVHKLSVKS